MVSKVFIVSLIVNSLFAAAFLGPLLYGYIQYDYNLERYVSPSYEPPIINFATNIVDYRVGEGKFLTVLEVANYGEISVFIEYLNASMYTQDGEYITDMHLLSSVEIGSGDRRNVTLYIDLDDDALERIVRYYLEGMKTSFKIVGRLGIYVFSSSVEFPLRLNVNIPEKLVKDYLNQVRIEFKGLEIMDSDIILMFRVFNPTVFSSRVVDVSLDLYTLDGDMVGWLTLVGEVGIGGGGEADILLDLYIDPDSIPLLVEYFGMSDSATFVVRGSITLLYEDYSYILPFETSIEIGRDAIFGLMP
jgi:LEA14-like dessication related protein